MLAILGNHLQHLNAEIESYEQLLAQKREEVQKLTQLQGQVVETLGQLQEVVQELREVEPEAIAILQAAAAQIFTPDTGNGEATDESESTQEKPADADEPEPDKDGSHQEKESPSDPTPEATHSIRLSGNVVYDPDEAVVYAGINSYNRAKAWGDWLCFTHTVGERFEVSRQSRSPEYTYDLVVFGLQPDSAQQLADSNLAKSPTAPENASWQPQKRPPLGSVLRPRSCRPGDLAVGDIAGSGDGREYRITGVSDDGSVVKGADGDGQEVAFSVGALYLVQKAEAEVSQEQVGTAAGAFGNGQAEQPGWEIGDRVRIRSRRYQGQYEGREAMVAAEPSTFGIKVDVGEGDPIFFLKDEVVAA